MKPILTKKTLNSAIKNLESGNLVIFPTETVYGIGADATNIKAIKKIYSLKKRPKTNPLICHFKNINHVKENFNLNKLEAKLASLFWPGPLTLILNKKKNSLIQSFLSNNQDLVGCRVPKHEITKKILNAVKFPVAAPSANISTKISTTRYSHFSKNFKKKAYIIDGGITNLGLESTVIQTFNKGIKILRLGSITIEEIQKKIPNIKIITKKINSKLSPGNTFKHYSPNLPLRINVKKVKKNECLLNFGKNKLKSSICEYNLSIEGNLKEASKNYFNLLHIIDKCKCSGIAVAPIPNKDLGRTINDRLIRASKNY